LLLRLLARLRTDATAMVGAKVAVVNTAATELGTAVAGGLVVASAVVDVTAVAAVVVNTVAMAAVNPARTAPDNRLPMAIAVAKMVLAVPVLATTPHTEARAKPALGPTINVTSNTPVATVVQASNLAASAVVVAVAASVVAQVAVALPADADESPTPTIGVLSPARIAPPATSIASFVGRRDCSATRGLR
jgi:hypothetical protein